LLLAFIALAAHCRQNAPARVLRPDVAIGQIIIRQQIFDK
jgi:hypothetical protein